MNPRLQPPPAYPLRHARSPAVASESDHAQDQLFTLPHPHAGPRQLAPHSVSGLRTTTLRYPRSLLSSIQIP